MDLVRATRRAIDQVACLRPSSRLIPRAQPSASTPTARCRACLILCLASVCCTHRSPVAVSGDAATFAGVGSLLERRARWPRPGRATTICPSQAVSLSLSHTKSSEPRMRLGLMKSTEWAPMGWTFTSWWAEPLGPLYVHGLCRCFRWARVSEPTWPTPT